MGKDIGLPSIQAYLESEGFVVGFTNSVAVIYKAVNANRRMEVMLNNRDNTVGVFFPNDDDDTCKKIIVTPDKFFSEDVKSFIFEHLM